jgi:alkane 1-monooxygenase
MTAIRSSLVTIWETLPYYIGALAPAAAYIGIKEGGIWLLVPVALLLLWHPIFDWLLGESHARAHSGAASFISSLPLYAMIPIQGALIIWALQQVSVRAFSVPELIGVVYAIGLSGGPIAITVAHELVHRTNKWERALGLVPLAMACYMSALNMFSVITRM